MQPMSTQAFAKACQLGLQLASTVGQLQMTMLVASAHFWSEIFTGKQSPAAKRIIEQIWASPDGEHKVLKLALG